MEAYNAGYIFGFVCALIIPILIALAVAALVMRVACSMCQEEPPEFGRAMGIVFVQGLAGFVFGLVVALIVRGTITSNLQSMQIAANMISLPFTMLITSAILHKMVPTTTFSKAVLIWLAQIVIVVVVAIVLVIVLSLVMGGLVAGRR